VGDRFPVVGIGASAGGVEALEALFTAMPPDSGMAFVVVTHLDPRRESLLAQIIGRHTNMPVAEAQDGDAVEPDRVYVLPPAAILTIEQGRLRLRERGGELSERAPIDIFFSSLAEDRGEEAVGVVLSGGGSDGTLGIKAIKEHGGLTIAQGTNRTEPRFKDMPESAAATGLVDLIVPVERIPEYLLQYLRSGGEIEKERMTAAMAAIYELLHTRVGHDFSRYKDKTFGRRVQRRMQVRQFTDIDAYVQRLRNDPDEISFLFRDLLIGVTGFFRDEQAFRALETKVIPKLFEGKDADREVRVWVPGCSTGEEVYSIAMLLREHMDKLSSPRRVQVFGTDIDERALSVGRAGHYPASLLKDVSPERRQRFLRHEREVYHLVQEVRDLCIFSPHSLLRDPPFSRLDLISCRNLLIYFNADLQADIMPVFHYALRPEGFLFLGLSETITRHGDLFAPLDKQHHIYRRRNLVTPLPHALPQFAAKSRHSPGAARKPGLPGTLKADILGSAAALVSERFSPAYVVVNEHGEVLHYSTRTGKYLEPAAGAPSRDLLALARKGLRLDLRAALRTAIQKRQSVTKDRITVDLNGEGLQTIDLTVQPVTQGDETVYLVVFADVGPIRPREHGGQGAPPSADDATVQQLERELQETKERLQGTIEELETSNEELKSSNEEALSVNEELQSTNEELEAAKEETQSINEELQTVNAELQRKVADLDQANSDLQNIFNSTQIGTVFLDRHLVIRTFTPAALQLFSLIPADRGRPLIDIKSRLDGPDLEREIQEVLERKQPIERRVTANHGARHYLMRLLPYERGSGAIEGVLATFTDITSVVVSEERQRMLAAELSHRIKNTLTVVAAIATQTGKHASNLEEYLKTFLGRLRSLAATHELLSRTEWADAPLHAMIERELAPLAEADGQRLTFSGPPVELTPRAAVSFGMVLHELATNSIKYGALSIPEGRLQVSWELRQQKAPAQLELRWVESGGPAPTASAQHGFGLEFIERAVQSELEGTAEIAFERTGLRCTITVPLSADVFPGPAAGDEGGADRGP
jgi:two-component system, chemotaxis family, CheB/CheR fusion protein